MHANVIDMIDRMDTFSLFPHEYGLCFEHGIKRLVINQSTGIPQLNRRNISCGQFVSTPFTAPYPTVLIEPFAINQSINIL